MDRRRLTIALLAALSLSAVVTFFLNRKINLRIRNAAAYAASRAEIRRRQPSLAARRSAES